MTAPFSAYHVFGEGEVTGNAYFLIPKRWMSLV